MRNDERNGKRRGGRRRDGGRVESGPFPVVPDGVLVPGGGNGGGLVGKGSGNLIV